MKMFENIEYGLFISLAVLTAILIYRTVITYWGKDMVMRKVILHSLDNYQSVTGQVNFQFELLASEEVTFSILSKDEAQVNKIIENSSFPSGDHSVKFDTVALEKGWYWYRLETKGQRITKKFRIV